MATKLLEDHGSLLPFGGKLGADGIVTVVATYEGDTISDGSTADVSESSVGLIRDVLRNAAKDTGVHAVALLFDSRVRFSSVGQPRYAVTVHVEHRSGRAVKCFLPYTKAGEGVIGFGEPIYEPAVADIFIDKPK